MNRRQIRELFLEHRNARGLLDLDALRAEESQEQADKAADAYEQRRTVRLQQGWPEYRIEAEIRTLRESQKRGK